VVAPQHRLARLPEVRVADLAGEPYLSRLNGEFGEAVDRLFGEQKVSCVTVYESERDDWILAMAAAGLGFALMPEHCVDHPGVAARRVVAPEFWREVALVTVRGRPHSPAVAALVAEATRRQCVNRLALPAQRVGRPCELRAIEASFT
jgi:LysR family transcriptional regulator, hydrogen peroxide-inducible genes activator